MCYLTPMHTSGCPCLRLVYFAWESLLGYWCILQTTKRQLRRSFLSKQYVRFLMLMFSCFCCFQPPEVSFQPELKNFMNVCISCYSGSPPLPSHLARPHLTGTHWDCYAIVSLHGSPMLSTISKKLTYFFLTALKILKFLRRPEKKKCFVLTFCIAVLLTNSHVIVITWMSLFSYPFILQSSNAHGWIVRRALSATLFSTERNGIYVGFSYMTERCGTEPWKNKWLGTYSNVQVCYPS